jgi:hypothetical protein
MGREKMPIKSIVKNTGVRTEIFTYEQLQDGTCKIMGYGGDWCIAPLEAFVASKDIFADFNWA